MMIQHRTRLESKEEPDEKHGRQPVKKKKAQISNPEEGTENSTDDDPAVAGKSLIRGEQRAERKPRKRSDKKQSSTSLPQKQAFRNSRNQAESDGNSSFYVNEDYSSDDEYSETDQPGAHRISRNGANVEDSIDNLG